MTCDLAAAVKSRSESRPKATTQPSVVDTNGMTRG